MMELCVKEVQVVGFYDLIVFVLGAIEAGLGNKNLVHNRVPVYMIQ